MAPQRLNVMQFNIEYGGTGVDFSMVAKAIQVADADIVAIQEGCGSMQRLAEDLGWDHYDVRTQVVSKFPLIHPNPPVGGAIYVELSPGEVIAVINVHPPSSRFGPTKIAKGMSVDQVLHNEQVVRLRALQPSLDVARELMDADVPVILLGDFNAPSHRDWTNETVGLRPHLSVAVVWPTSVETEAIGLTDVYRAMYPDPLTHQGLTWPADRPFVKGYNPARRGDPADRIDLMFASEQFSPSSVKLMGEAGSEYSDLSVEPWPTDHRAIVATFDVEPVPTPTVVSSLHRVVELGTALSVVYCASDQDAARVTLVPSATETVSDVIEQTTPDSHRGSVEIDTGDCVAGLYDLVLTDATGRELAVCDLWLLEPGATPQIASDKSEYEVGEAITLRWEQAPGNRADWVAVFERDADPATAPRILWTYTDATVTGQLNLDDALPRRRRHLPPGDYTAHLMLDDLQQSLAQTDFTVG